MFGKICSKLVGQVLTTVICAQNLKPFTIRGVLLKLGGAGSLFQVCVSAYLWNFFKDFKLSDLFRIVKIVVHFEKSSMNVMK